MCSYLYRRGAVYCTRLVVPRRLRPIIGKSDLGRSLKTKDRDEAKRLLPAWLEEAQSMLAAAERESARREAPPSNGAAYPMTQADADWEEENARFWRHFDQREEAKAEAAERLEMRLQRPEAELTTDEASAAWLLREAREERDRYRDRYRRRKRRDEQRGTRTGESVAVSSRVNLPLRLNLQSPLRGCSTATPRRMAASPRPLGSGEQSSIILWLSSAMTMRTPLAWRT